MLLALTFLLLFLILWGALIVAEPLARHSLDRVAHLTAKFRYRDYLPVFVLLAAGGAIAVWAGDGFVDLAELVHARSPLLQTIDLQWHDWAVSERYTGATTFFAVMSVIGGPLFLGVVTGLFAAWMVIERRYRWAIYLVVTAGGGGVPVYVEDDGTYEGVDAVIDKQLTREARRRWARRLAEMALVFRSTGREETARLARAAEAALADDSRAARHIPFVRGLAMRGLEMGAEVALGRAKLADVSRAPARKTRP